MVLPPYVYRSDWRETKYHIAEVCKATDLSCMLYNNPVAYGTDFIPEQIAELAAGIPNLHAVKESSTDVRRVTGIRALLDERLTILVGVDDCIVEGVAAGATGWVAGLVSAFPKESVDLYNYAMNGEADKARGALRMVPAAAPPRHRAKIRPAHQACPGKGRHGQCPLPSAEAGAGRAGISRYVENNRQSNCG